MMAQLLWTGQDGLAFKNLIFMAQMRKDLTVFSHDASSNLFFVLLSSIYVIRHDKVKGDKEEKLHDDGTNLTEL